MATIQLRTAHDLIEHLSDYTAQSPSGRVLRQIKQSILSALREIANAHNWSYYYRPKRLATSPT